MTTRVIRAKRGEAFLAIRALARLGAFGRRRLQAGLIGLAALGLGGLVSPAAAAPLPLAEYRNNVLEGRLPAGWSVTWVDHLRAVHATPDPESEKSPSLLVGLAFKDRRIDVPALISFLERSVFNGGRFFAESERVQEDGHFLTFVNDAKSMRVAAWLATFEADRPSVLSMSISQVEDFSALEAPELIRRVASTFAPVGAKKQSSLRPSAAQPAARPAAARAETPGRVPANARIAAQPREAPKPIAAAPAAAPARATAAAPARIAAAPGGGPAVGIGKLVDKTFAGLERGSDGLLRARVVHLSSDGSAARSAPKTGAASAKGAWTEELGGVRVKWRDGQEPDWRLRLAAEGLALNGAILRPIVPIATTRLNGTYRSATSTTLATAATDVLGKVAIRSITLRQDGTFAMTALGLNRREITTRGSYDIADGAMRLNFDGGGESALSVFLWPGVNPGVQLIGLDSGAYALLR